MSKIRLALIALTLALLMPLGIGTQAEAAELKYVAGTKVADIGDWEPTKIQVDITWVNSKWPVEKALKKVAKKYPELELSTCKGTTRVQDYRPCGDITMNSGPEVQYQHKKGNKPYISVWGTDKTITSADVTLRRKPTNSKATREKDLVYALTRAVGR